MMSHKTYLISSAFSSHYDSTCKMLSVRKVETLGPGFLLGIGCRYPLSSIYQNFRLPGGR